MNELANLVFDAKALRADFPLLQQHIKGKPLVYLDNAATTQKPSSVLQAMQSYYLSDNANIHRGVHTLSVRATQAYEKAREQVKGFLNAAHAHEIIFVDGTTEAINLLAHSYGRSHLSAGDEIILTMMEHHSNIVPWQMLCEQNNLKLKVIPINDAGELDLETFKNLLHVRTKLVAVTHISNAIGTINPIKEIIDLAHAANAVVLIDGAQAAPHLPINVQELNCDFYTFSAHKMYGPLGVGVLYGKSELLERMSPYQGGGDMIASVSFEKTTYNKLPHKFEAGTPNIAGVIGLGEAIQYLNRVGLAHIQQHEQQLLRYAKEALSSVSGLRLIGSTAKQAAVISFVLDDIHPHDIGTVLDDDAIAIRAGHHCAMPLMSHLNLAATARASFGLYNTEEDIDALLMGIEKVKRIFV